MPLFNGDDLRQFVELASYVTVNDYEAQVLLSRTGWSHEDVAAGARVHRHARRARCQHPCRRAQYAIPAVPAERVVDPTGCGDAFRGGLLYGIEHGLDWETTGRLASLMGSLKIAHQGPQNHKPSRDEIRDRFQAAFGFHYA